MPVSAANTLPAATGYDRAMPLPPPPPRTITALADTLIEQAITHRQRRLLLLCGEQIWGHHATSRLLQHWQPETLLWVGRQLPAATPGGSRCIAGKKCRQLLGREFAAVVFDAWDGFDPDAFGAVSGTLRAGGLLILLTPPLPQWPRFNDPEHARIASAPTPVEQVSGRYLHRLARIFSDAPEVTRINQPMPGDCQLLDPLPPTTPVGNPACDDFDHNHQQRAVAAVLRVANGHRRRPVVLTADRGRGKSAALGIAAAELMLARPCHIAVTGPRRQALTPVFKHCAKLLPHATHSDQRIDTGQASLQFIAPDVLLEHPRQLDLLLVDEAAALPTDLLQRLLRQYNRIAFATTVHGYEGSGRGFALRFNRILDRNTRGWRSIKLETPIRWAANDPLEALTFRALLLDAEPTPDAIADQARGDNCRTELIDRDQLLNHPAPLNELFGLLVQSHYRTRPYDLRQLLDGTNVSIWVLRHDSHIVGTALLATEGGFDATTSAAILAGHRRPRGHLLAEALSAHLGLQQAATLRGQRIMRIAIHPHAQRRRLGVKLITAIASHASEQGIDYLGSSFGAEPELLRFWQHNGFAPVRISARSSASSGSHSAILVRGLSKAGRALTALARQRFRAQFPIQLSDHLSTLDSALALQLLAATTTAAEADANHNHQPQQLEHQDWLDLCVFGHAKRVYEDCLQPITTLTRHTLSDPDCPLAIAQRQILMTRVLQQRPWNEVAKQAGLSGRAQVIARLRDSVNTLIKHYADPPTRQLADYLRQTPP